MRRLFRLSLFACAALALFSCSDFQENEESVELKVEPTEITLEADAEDFTICVSSSTAWNVANLPDWISLKDVSPVKDWAYTWEVKFACEQSEFDRTGFFFVSDASRTNYRVTVEQKGQRGAEVPVQSLSLSPETLILQKGEEAVITATVLPDDASNPALNWTVSDEQIVSFSPADCRVIALAPGSATISATTIDGGFTAGCKIKVEQHASSVSLVFADTDAQAEAFEMELNDYKPVQLKAVVLPEDAEDKSVEWHSADESIVKVSGGLVTAIGVGEADVYATTVDGGLSSGSCHVTVVCKVTSITITPISLTLKVGETRQLTAEVTPANAGNKKVIWESSDATIATVDQHGLVTAVAPGSAEIKVTTEDGGYFVTCAVTVEKNVIHVVSVTLKPASLELVQGNSAVIEARVLPENATYRSLTWVTSDYFVATVSEDGTVTAITVGSAVVTASSVENPSVSASCKVTVLKREIPVTAIELSRTSLELTPGHQVALTATVLPADSTNPSLVWISSDSMVATVNETGIVTAIAVGSAVITARSEGNPEISATCMVTVKAAQPEAVDLGLSVKWASFNVGASAPEEFGDYFAWGETEPKSDYSWSSYKWCNGSNNTLTKYNNNSLYGSVDNKTVLDLDDDAAHVNWGNDWRMPTLEEQEELRNNCSWEWTTQNGVTGLLITSKIIGHTDKSIFLPTGGRDIYLRYMKTEGYYWSSSLRTSDTGVAYIIYFDYESKNITRFGRSFGLTVRPVFDPFVAVSAITLSHSSVNLEIGETTQLNATIFPSDATEKTIRWSSNNTSVATVSGEGLVTAVSAGTATITAYASSGVSASCTVAVAQPIVHVTSVSLSQTSLELTPGKTTTLTATVAPSNANNISLSWSSSNTSIATVSQTGTVTAKAVGSAVITASSDDNPSIKATCAITVMAAQPEAVDLGLPSGLKWASWNIGASKPEEYGDYFAWGETEPKANYSWSTYKWSNGSNSSLTKYNSNSSYGTLDYKTVLVPEDDAAHVNWGDSWRMPTKVEQDELINNCTWTWTTQNGVNGELVTGPNGNSIFFPAAGDRVGADSNYSDSRGYCWSSSLDMSSQDRAYYVRFYSSDEGWYYHIRCDGFSVRPVYGAFVAVSSISLNRSSVNLDIGGTSQLTATISPSNATEKTIRWVSSNSSVATVSDSGLVSAKAAGTTTITAYASSGKSASCNVTVAIPEIRVTSVILDKTSLELTVGDEDIIHAQVLPTNADNKSLTWTTSNSAVAVVDETGRVNGLSPGSAVITATSEDNPSIKASCTVTVNAAQPEAVDLGLPSGLKWASWNIGASKPEEYGDYFAWGETEPKANYSWSTYKFELGTDFIGPFSKYVTNSSYGAVDNKTVLEPEDDAALVNWGSSWRMPTDSEWTELRENCTWVWTTQNGVYGRLVTSKTNGNSIFLPAAGNIGGTDIYHGNAGPYGIYWSSSLGTDYPDSSCNIYFYSDIVRRDDAYYRFNGFSVRPVYSPFVAVSSISLSQTSANLNLGATIKLSATLYPSNATEKTVRWVSSSRYIATVSDSGQVTAIAIGSATITAYASSGKSASCSVTVKAAQPEAVDLGLPSGLKWASCNVGASSPEEYGDYFAWGETELKSNYSWSNYKFELGTDYNGPFSKYVTNSSLGTVDNKSVLEPEDDAAHVNWGGSWRMPTDAEWTELRNNCTWTWTTQNGVNGRLVTGPNGSSIFLPASGYRYGTYLDNAGSYGNYWSSSLYTDNPYYAWNIYFNSGYVYRNDGYRCGGFSVRPVTE